MYVRTIKFKNFYGDTIEREFTFNLNQAQLLELEVESGGSVRKLITDVIEKNKAEDVINFVKTIVKASYGVISDDGLYFDKTEEVWNRFYMSNAYDKLFMELINSEEELVRFISETIPNAEDI